ncbi:restriction endonuclease subunit S [Klebsiella michiganensis]|uniref:restriction endonuclease subunit S n=1 Tax=Klebsiella michiganensis TaxID=1134687 RepID=UPI002106AF77|nr:restriction endonuclease subunit S [Klebsiella michiganensis]UTX59092.1 restriction endonuclease subunit S [Klebsiella michiganensis]
MAVEKLIVDHIDTWTTALQTRSTAGRGSSGKIDLYGIKKLRELILELAVRGKLVPQDPNDEPASELLKRIAAEKAELVKLGKIKKPKPLPEISEEEKPFELPVGWEWARFGDATYNRDAERIPLSSDERMNRSGTFDYYGASGIIDKIDDYIFDKPLLLIGEDGANLINRSTPIAFMAHGQFWVNNHAHVIDGISEEYLNYLCIYINAISLENYITGTAQPKMNQAKMNTILIGLPPEHEQLKIKNKVTELLSLCDQLEQHSLSSLDAHQQLVETLLATLTDSQNADELAENWARISEHFDTLFTTEASIDALKQTILQLAVMGKLVPQDPNDEPASELLKRIAQEKAQLVKDGKIKKQKPLPPISDEEKPFELPEGWEWVKLGNILHDIKYGTSQKCDYNISGYPVLRIPNIVKGIIDLADIKYGALTDSELKDLTLNENDLLFIRSNGSTNIVGQSTLVQQDLKDHAYAGYIIRVRLHNKYINATYINMIMKSNLIREQIEGPIRTTTGVKNINSNELMGLLVPLPPKNEQGIIIKKISEIDTTISNLKVNIQSAQQTQLHLADALTDAAIN